MEQTKFPGIRPSGFREGFRRFISIYERNGLLGHVTQMLRTNFRSPYANFTQTLALIGQEVSEKKTFGIVNGRTRYDGRTPDHGYTISSSGQLKRGFGI